nr:hypothetical protein [Tanacetum cinerariifolium]
MSFGSQAAGEAIVLKFDMHVYTSVLTSDEDSSVADPPSTAVRAEDILLVSSMSEFLRFPMAGGMSVCKGTTLAATEAIPQHSTPPLPIGDPIPKKTDHQRVVKFENERILAA